MCCGTVTFYLFEVGEAPKIFSLCNCPCCKAARGCVRQSVMVVGMPLNACVCLRVCAYAHTVCKHASVCARLPACLKDRPCFLLRELCRPGWGCRAGKVRQLHSFWIRRVKTRGRKHSHMKQNGRERKTESETESRKGQDEGRSGLDKEHKGYGRMGLWGLQGLWCLKGNVQCYNEK